jgi:2Fe-2S ferredoxin
MLLLKDNLPLDYFGECGGMGRCATCIIKTIGLTGNAAIKERNEHTTLSKIGYINDNIRLSCQILITKELENMEIELLEQQ